MKWQTGSVDDNGENDEGVKVTLGTDYSGKLDPSPKKKNVKVAKKAALFKKAEVPLIILGAAVLAFIVFFLFFKPVKNQGPEKLPVENVAQDPVQERIMMLEERIALMEGQAKESEVLKKRYDQMEASLFMKIDLLTKKMEKLEARNKKILAAKAAVRPAPVKTVAKKKTPPSAGKKKTVSSTTAKSVAKKKVVVKKVAKPKAKSPSVHHTVKKGENLYRIGIKYGLKMDELRKLNKLGPDTSIYPGQKLRVKP